MTSFRPFGRGARLPLVWGIPLVVAATLISAYATPSNKAALVKHFGDFLPAEMDSCATCHVRAHADGAKTLKDFPHNPYGNALRQLGEDVKLVDRIEKIARQDADGDGVSNVEEILAGTNPGDKTKAGHPDEVLVAKFDEFLERYPWRPFDPVKRPEVPKPANAAWVREPIDAFVAELHEKHGLTPRPEVSKGAWLRRVHLDLTGLSPTPEERAAFLADNSPDAYGKVVDGLLASPAYGERWGRHWMDVWRYSDWAGYKDALRESQRHIWQWRDWIVESLNEDKGYDRMVHEMLAGDEIAPEDPDTLRATGFLARSYFAERDQWMDNVVSHTAQGFLGITLGCAKCHDHMYDDLSMRDYYSMRAIFQPYNVRTDRLPGELDVMKMGLPRAYDRGLTVSTYIFDKGDERFPLKDENIPPAPPAVLGGEYEPVSIKLSRYAQKPSRRPFVRKMMLDGINERITEAKEELDVKAAKSALAALEAEYAIEDLEDAGKKDSDEYKAAAKELTKLQRTRDLDEATWQVADKKADLKRNEDSLAKAKEAKDKGKEAAVAKIITKRKSEIKAAEKTLVAAEKAMKEEVTTKFKPREQGDYPAESTGRRLAFAKWLTNERNPLTARVAMNQIWLRHIGQAIVPTVNEFGAQGQAPTHPALLDWLAAEFMEKGWSMKAMHREIVLSSTYRMDSTPDMADAKADPDNQFLWRMPSQRMEGEIVRDNLLYIAGALDDAQGGPDIPNDEAQTSKRRSIYLRHAHEKLVEFVQIFDGPKVTECYQRDTTVQPHQALAMANSQLTFDQSKKIADELTSAVSADNAEFVDQAFVRILSREPKKEERTVCLDFLEGGHGRENLVMVLFNHNDFVTIR